MSDNQLTIRDRLEAILESINLIIEWTLSVGCVSIFIIVL